MSSRRMFCDSFCVLSEAAEDSRCNGCAVRQAVGWPAGVSVPICPSHYRLSKKGMNVSVSVSEDRVERDTFFLAEGGISVSTEPIASASCRRPSPTVDLPPNRHPPATESRRRRLRPAGLRPAWRRLSRILSAPERTFAAVCISRKQLYSMIFRRI